MIADVLDVALDLAFDAGQVEIMRFAWMRVRHLVVRGLSVAAGLALVGAAGLAEAVRLEVDARARVRADAQLRRVHARNSQRSARLGLA